MKHIIAIVALATLAACGTYPAEKEYTFQSTYPVEKAQSDAFMCNGHPTPSKAAKCMEERGYKLVAVRDIE